MMSIAGRVAASVPVTEACIELVGVRKSYRGTVALDGVDLTIVEGEIFVLLGPNGAGKTTALEICQGFRRAEAGEVRVFGEDPRRAGGELRARVGIVSQQSSDFAELTVLEAVSTVAGYFPAPRRPADVIEAVGLGGQRGSRCERLSGGQRRRLDVALGIVGRPELLYLDEPTTGFDAQARRTFWTLIEQLNSAGTTILLTTHYLDEAERLAHRVGVLAAGRLLDVGAPAVIGGRGEAAARVRWIGADGPREVRTTTPTELISTLAREYGEVPGLVVERPSLADVYVRMIERANIARAEQSGPERGEHA